MWPFKLIYSFKYSAHDIKSKTKCSKSLEEQRYYLLIYNSELQKEEEEETSEYAWLSSTRSCNHGAHYNIHFQFILLLTSVLPEWCVCPTAYERRSWARANTNYNEKMCAFDDEKIP